MKYSSYCSSLNQDEGLETVICAVKQCTRGTEYQVGMHANNFEMPINEREIGLKQSYQSWYDTDQVLVPGSQSLLLTPNKLYLV